MNIFVSTTFLPDGSPLIEALELCSQQDISSVEIGSNHCYQKNYDYLNDFSFNYLMHNYFPIPLDSFVLNIASFDEQIRKRSIQHIKSAIDFCKIYNSRLYTFHPGFLTDPMGSNDSKVNYDFKWDQKKLKNINHIKAKELMYEALDIIVLYAQKNKIKIAIETEGSLAKKDHLLMQEPHEYEEFMTRFTNSDIGINLNIGHLNLASKAFKFSRSYFVTLVETYIVALELSHNNRIEDQHLPLRKDEWYWSIIKNPKFKDIYKILDFRNTKVSDIKKNIEYIKEVANGV
jgi:sugar phosphate isomerase/epimerase